jgi:general secretion pathway protein A
MYESFFGLHHEPFSIAPDPRFLYLSDRHREALALLFHGLARGGSFVMLTGEVGAGKTTVWRRFLDDLPSSVDVANVVNPKLGVDALLVRVFEDLHVELPAGHSPVDMIDALHGHLLLAHARGRRLLIVIDEAQALAPDVLEQLRLLTNLDWSGRKLQVMLIGQPELRRMLERPELEPVAQRIVARYHLDALSERESAAYIEHRLRVAGMSQPMPFDGEAIGLIHRLSRGIPRRINVLCDRALALAHAAGTRRIGREIVERAAVQAFGPRAPAAPMPQPAARGAGWPRALVVGAGAGIAFAAGGWLLPRLADHPQPAIVAAALSPSPAPTPPSVPASLAAPAPAIAAAMLPAAPAARASASSVVASVALPERAVASTEIPSTPDEAVTLRLLAGRWGVPAGAADPCSAVVKEGLACYRARGGIPTIRLLDRPSVLHLVDDQGRPGYALLVALRGDRATIAAAGARREVALADLAHAWRGEFTTLWRTPPGWRDGAPGVDDAWLAQQFARIGAVVTGTTKQERLLAFQLAQGLTPDGVAGPLTLMQLNRAGGVDEPRL